MSNGKGIIMLGKSGVAHIFATNRWRDAIKLIEEEHQFDSFTVFAICRESDAEGLCRFFESRGQKETSATDTFHAITLRGVLSGGESWNEAASKVHSAGFSPTSLIALCRQQDVTAVMKFLETRTLCKPAIELISSKIDELAWTLEFSPPKYERELNSLFEKLQLLIEILRDSQIPDERRNEIADKLRTISTLSENFAAKSLALSATTVANKISGN